MKIGVILEQDISGGGGFQQALSTLVLLNTFQSGGNEFVFYTTNARNIDVLKSSHITANYLPCGLITKFFALLKRNRLTTKYIGRYLSGFGSNAFEKRLIKDNIDIIYYLSPTWLCLLTDNINYVFTLWDLCHRDYPEFPEVRESGEFYSRELLYNDVLKKAFAVIVDSDLGKENVIFRYGLSSERVHVLPFVATQSVVAFDGERQINIKEKYRVSNDYIFYPAQFWAHKNHSYILEALSILRDRYKVTLDAVFTGIDKGNLGYIKQRTYDLSLTERIHFIGQVDAQEMPHLYQQSRALVMPTYFGPTNLPPIEAFHLGVPVFYSDLAGLRDQVEGAAFLMDLGNADSLASQLNALLAEKLDVDDVIANGKIKAAAWTEQDYWQGLTRIFNSYRPILMTWKNG
ncbi:MAG: glycosyltransferase family 1 protein [Gammaproteobacteria bacterium]